jgi:putative ABC transport system substrate-binding protein
VKRREFIILLGGGAAAWPLAARAQQRERMRRIGVLMNLTSDDPEGQGRLAAFLQGMQEAGWSVGRNVRIDLRWGGGDLEVYRGHASELVSLAPDILFGAGGIVALALQRATRTIPIVFAAAADPVATGLVASLARPDGNATGTTIFEFSMGGKWLELLKQIAPTTTRAAVLRDASNPAGMGAFGAIQTAAPMYGVDVRPVDVRDVDAIERGIAAFAGGANSGLIVTQNSLAVVHRKLIIRLAGRHRLPAIYPWPAFVTDGGLMSYGPDAMNSYRHAASYVDRILKGEKPSDLPVQAPTKYGLFINLGTAKSLGLEVPAPLLALADEVIE